MRSKRKQPIPRIVPRGKVKELVQSLQRSWSSLLKYESAFRASAVSKKEYYRHVNDLLRSAAIDDGLNPEEFVPTDDDDEELDVFRKFVTEHVKGIGYFLKAVSYQAYWLDRWKKRNRPSKDPQAARIFQLHNEDPKTWSWSKLGREFNIDRAHARTKYRRHKEWQEFLDEHRDTLYFHQELTILHAKMRADVDKLERTR